MTLVIPKNNLRTLLYKQILKTTAEYLVPVTSNSPIGQVSKLVKFGCPQGGAER